MKFSSSTLENNQKGNLAVRSFELATARSTKKEPQKKESKLIETYYFVAKDGLGKQVNGTIDSREPYLAYKRLLNEYHFNKQEHKNILRSYCSYLWMKKWKDITDSLLKKRSQYVYSYLSLYPKIESWNEEYEIWRIHWGDVKKTYEHEIWSNLKN